MVTRPSRKEETPHDAHQLHRPRRRRARAGDADAPALTYKDDDRSPTAGCGAGAAFAAGLRAARAAPRRAGRRSTSTSGSRPSLAIFGTSAAGGVFVPVNPLLQAAAGRATSSPTAACAVLVTSAGAARAAARRARRPQVGRARRARRRAAAAGPSTARSTTRARLGADWPAEAEAATRRAGDVIDVDMAAILYTSGSTGQAEGRGALAPQPARRRRERQRSTSATAPDDVILAALPLSFDAGFSQLTTGFTVGAHVVLDELPAARRRGPAVRQAPGHRAHLRAAAVDPARRAGVAGGGDAQPALLRQHRRAHAAGRRWSKLRAIFPRRQALPDVRADRGVPVDLPRPGRGRPPARLDRQGDPERRDPRGAPGRHAAASPARRASSCTAARSWRWGTGTTRSAPPSGSARRPGARPA